jgi:hypothetical protein
MHHIKISQSSNHQNSYTLPQIHGSLLEAELAEGSDRYLLLLVSASTR